MMKIRTTVCQTHALTEAHVLTKGFATSPVNVHPDIKAFSVRQVNGFPQEFDPFLLTLFEKEATISATRRIGALIIFYMFSNKVLNA